MLRAKVLGSNNSKQVASPDFSPASPTHPPGPASTAGPAAASRLPQVESPPALPDQALPEASANGSVPEQAASQSVLQHSESLATAVSDTPALPHGKRKRKAEKECVRAAAGTEAAVESEDALAAGTEAAAAVESEVAGGESASRSHAADEAPEPKQARQWKGSSKNALQGTLQAAFAKAKVLD